MVDYRTWFAYRSPQVPVANGTRNTSFPGDMPRDGAEFPGGIYHHLSVHSAPIHSRMCLEEARSPQTVPLSPRHLTGGGQITPEKG